MHFNSIAWLLVVLGCFLLKTGQAAPVQLAENLQPEAGQYDNVLPRDVFEGDIAGVDLTNAASPGWHFSQSTYPKNAVLSSDRWANGKVPFVISQRFTENETAIIVRAIEEINNVTEGINLVARTNEQNYVNIVRGGPRTGCWSYVGVIGGRQDLNLEVPVKVGDAHCMHKGIVEHELLHAIGLWHEQSRSDRNDHVEVNWDNIAGNQRHNFDFYSDEYTTHFGLQYDYGSLMHYGTYDFAIQRNLWTLRPKAPFQDTPIGQRKGLSITDISKLNLMYAPQR